eukprot:3490340-Amphidinium_carterae.1
MACKDTKQAQPGAVAPCTEPNSCEPRQDSPAHRFIAWHAKGQPVAPRAGPLNVFLRTRKR